MAQIEIKADSIPQIQKQLATIAFNAQDARSSLHEACEWYLLQVDDRFVNESDAEGNRWQPLSVKYARAKAKAGGINKILQFRGRMRRVRYQVYRDRAVIGSNLPYAIVHEMGATLRSFARSRMVEFKVSKSGRSRFAKTGKGNFQQAVEYGETTRTIPRRSFLRPSAANELKIGQIILDRVSQVRD